MLSTKERQTLQVLSRQDGLSGSAMVRSLIRREARQRGLLPNPGTVRDEEVQDYEQAST